MGRVEIVGDTVFYNGVEVARILPTAWPTLLQGFASAINAHPPASPLPCLQNNGKVK